MTRLIVLIGTGVGLGVVHVLTGPDHMSAIATLSANVRSVQHAFCLGVRWGLGHSTGLLLVGIILLLVTRKSNDDTVHVPERLSLAFETLVGIFMVLLGIYGIRRALKKKSKAHEYIPDSASQEIPITSLPVVEDIPTVAVGSSYQSQADAHAEAKEADADDEEAMSEPIDPARTQSCCQHISGFFANISTRTMAVLAGIIHGLAGPGGVLGVIPAVQLHTGRLASTYLLSFCLSSTITMGIFATIYATCSSRLVDQGQLLLGSGRPSRWEFRIECASACLSILVGSLGCCSYLLASSTMCFPRNYSARQ